MYFLHKLSPNLIHHLKYWKITITTAFHCNIFQFNCIQNKNNWWKAFAGALQSGSRKYVQLRRAKNWPFAPPPSAVVLISIFGNTGGRGGNLCQGGGGGKDRGISERKGDLRKRELGQKRKRRNALIAEVNV